MLTGEYAVLFGSQAFAIPTKLGQHLTVNDGKTKGELNWEAKDEKDTIWFHATFSIKTLEIIKTDNVEVAERLKNMLLFSKSISTFLDVESCAVTTKTEFPINFGLGTSSTLMNNLALWANIDPFKILNHSFSGSGFDLAVAQCNAPVLYHLSHSSPNWNKRNPNWDFTKKLFFIHLNEKAISREKIKTNINFTDEKLKEISFLTNELLDCKSLSQFNKLIMKHEEIVSSAIGKDTIKNKLFPNFDGAMKSLGAWGGDFILATGEQEYIEEFFSSKGYNSIFNYSELILNG